MCVYIYIYIYIYIYYRLKFFWIEFLDCLTSMGFEFATEKVMYIKFNYINILYIVYFNIYI